MKLCKNILIIAATILLAGSTLNAADILSRSDILWRIAGTDDPGKTAISARYKDTWHDIDTLESPIASACANDEGLHVFTADSAYLLYNPNTGKKKFGPLWPQKFSEFKIIGSCASNSTRPGSPIFVLFAKSGEEDQSQCAVLKLKSRRWETASQLDNLEIAQGDRASLAAASDDSIVILITTTEGWPKQLVRINGENVEQFDSLNYSTDDFPITGIVAAGADILAFGGIDGQNGQIRRINIENGKFAEAIELKGKADQPVVLSIPSGGDVSSHGRLMLDVYYPGKGKEWILSSASISTGQISEVENTSEEQNLTKLVKDVENIRMAFIITMMVLVAAAVLLNSKNRTTMPFTLPPGIMGANFVKRIIAAGIELLGIGTLVFMFSGIDQAQLQQVVEKQQQLTPQMAIYSLASFTIYLLYCIIFESTLGSTPVKLALGMQVCGRNMTKPKFTAILIRNFMKPVEMNNALLIIIFGCCPIFTRYRQRAGDMIAGVTVINRPVGIITVSKISKMTPDEQSTQQDSADQADSDDTDFDKDDKSNQ